MKISGIKFKLVAIVVIVLFFVSTWGSLGIKNERTGYTIITWSGWSALFNGQDFGLRLGNKTLVFDGIDGPYIKGDKIYKIDSNNEFKTSKIEDGKTISVQVSNADQDQFRFSLNNNYKIEEALHVLPDKLIAISDIEGNFNGFSSFLKMNHVIDNEYNWIFGNGHLVLVGDFVDRGHNVTPVLWLIYKLDYQSKEQGGAVHFVLGNHEIMNFQGNSGYNDKKYIKVAQAISQFDDFEKATKFMYSEKTELGDWLRTKNVIEKIGDYIFIHAGLSPEILKYNLDIPAINSITRKSWDKALYSSAIEDEIPNFLIGRFSPIWYRGMAIDYKYYNKITPDELRDVLDFYNARKIVIGHTVVSNIISDFDGRVIKIDLKHGQEKYSGLTKGLLIEGGVEYRIDDLGNKQVL